MFIFSFLCFLNVYFYGFALNSPLSLFCIKGPAMCALGCAAVKKGAVADATARWQR